MRILVSGGAGFIGSHFVKRLKRSGDDVVVLDKLTYSGNPANLPGDVELIEGDIAKPEDVAHAAAGCAAVVNFAAETHVDRSILAAEDFGRTEFRGTQVLLEHVRATGVRLVQVSTDEVYGDLEAGGSARETDPLRPSSPYSAAKAAGDLLVPAYARTFGVDASVTRGSNTYGPNQYPEKLIPLFVTNALDGEPLPLYGDGRQVRDWLHVEDHCAGIELALREGAAGEIYNIGGGDEHENIEVAQRLLELTGADRSLLRSVPDRPGHDRRYSLDTTKMRRLGWAPATRFADGLRETVDWYRDNRAWWEPIKSGEYRAYYERQYAERLAQATPV
ncbi:MAG TPA: dTDP-glucose 4,6-dehydratase [Gaiellaceae bacterium]|jgi:dTDP-glucose 4,6-dehydratase|nr:dTDP-glucose 4,6-dehydratase [Gaiellaceae bacterium]